MQNIFAHFCANKKIYFIGIKINVVPIDRFSFFRYISEK